MKSNRGLRFLLLAGLVSAFILWLLPVNSVTTDIFLLLASRTSIQPKVHSDAYASNTSDSLDVESSFMDTNITGTNPSLTDSEEVADLGGNPNNSTVNESFTTQPADITSPQDNIYSTLEPRTFISESSTGTDGFTQEFLSTRDITSSQNSTPREKPPLVTGLTTASMEDNQTICPRSTGMTEGEVLAIAIGAVFITILLSALFYQFSAFLKKKTAKRDSSVYIIENELHKFDMENNGDTRL